MQMSNANVTERSIKLRMESGNLFNMQVIDRTEH